MRKAFGSLFALLGMLAALLLGSLSSAQATAPPSNCSNILVNVVCEIDVDDNSVLNGNDIKVEILNKSLNGNELDILTVELDDILNDNVVNVPLSVEEILIVKDVVVTVFDDELNIVVIPSVVIVTPCGCPH